LPLYLQDGQIRYTVNDSHFIFLLISCKTINKNDNYLIENTEVIDLTKCHIKKLETSEYGPYLVEVLKILPYKGFQNNKILTANVFICKLIDLNDTIILFDIKNKKLQDYFDDNKIDLYYYLLIPKDTLMCPIKICISKPPNYNLPSRYKILCGFLGMLDD
jgi:hypothetical protein